MVQSNLTGLTMNRPTPWFLTCLAAGTRIATPLGGRSIEQIAVGDLVRTPDDGPHPVRWHGAQTLDGSDRDAPIRITRGTLGNRRDLLVSPQHRMLISGWRAERLFGCDEGLVPACHLVTDLTIRPAPCPKVTCHPLMSERHQIVLAEGCASESFYPGPTAMTHLCRAAHDEITARFARRSGDGPPAIRPPRPPGSSPDARRRRSGTSGRRFPSACR